MDDVQLAKRFAALEAQVKALSDQLGMQCPPFVGAGLSPSADPAPSGSTGAVPDKVLELVRAGKSTGAISLLRSLTGASLIEAKRIVDNL